MIRIGLTALLMLCALLLEPGAAQTTVTATGPKVTSLTYNGKELIWTAQTIFAQDRTPGSNNARPAITVNSTCPDASTVEFDVTVTMIKDDAYTCTSLLIQLPSIGISVPAIGTTQAANGGGGDVPVVPCVTPGFNFYVVDLNYPVVDQNHLNAGSAWQTGGQQFWLRVGSSNGGAMPISATTGAHLKGGSTATFKFAYRFAPLGTDIYAFNKTTIDAWVKSHAGLGQSWSDHRPVAELMYCQQTGYADNPAGYAQDKNINVNTPDGVALLQQNLQKITDTSVQLLQSANAQGVVVWDICGDPNPIITQSYVGDPRLLPNLSPAVDRFADQLFSTFKAANLKTGVCIRDCYYGFNASTGKWVPRPYNNETERRNELFSKIQYARERWGCTLIYIDSWTGSADTMQFLSWSFPDTLLMPEYSGVNPAAFMYFMCAPFSGVNAYRDQVPYSVRQYMPSAKQWSMAANLKFEGGLPLDQQSARYKEVANGIAHGDIYGMRAWWSGGDDWKTLWYLKGLGYW
jgi:hypothetical protein